MARKSASRKAGKLVCAPGWAGFRASVRQFVARGLIKEVSACQFQSGETGEVMQW